MFEFFRPERRATLKLWRGLYDLALLDVFALDRRFEILQAQPDRAACEDIHRAVMGDVQDGGPRQFVALGDVAPIDIVRDGDLRREGLPPDLVALLGARHREVDDRLQPADERI